MKWWFSWPPGVRGRVLLDYLRWPITIVVGVVVLYGVTLGVIAWMSDLTLDLVFSAGQVFTGFAGVGAAVAAIAGIAKQFERPAAKLVVKAERVIHPAVPGTFAITIFNDGDAPAFGVTLAVWSRSGGIDLGQKNRWRSGVAGDSGIPTLRAMDPLQPGEPAELSFAADHSGDLQGWVAWHGGSTVEFVIPASEVSPRK